jgi:hypothetical protein
MNRDLPFIDRIFGKLLLTIGAIGIITTACGTTSGEVPLLGGIGNTPNISEAGEYRPKVSEEVDIQIGASKTPELNTPTSTLRPTDTPEPMPTFTPSPTPTPTEIRLTINDFSYLTPEEVQGLWDRAPSEIDGNAKSNFSTTFPYLILYRDGKGDAQLVLNLLTGEKLSLLEAGIAEFIMKNPYNPEVDGKKGELMAFAPNISVRDADAEVINEADKETLEKMVEFILSQDVKWGDYRSPTADSTPIEYLETSPGWVANLTGGGQFLLRQDITRRYDINTTLFLHYYVLRAQGREWVIVFYKSASSQFSRDDKYVAVAIPEDRFLRGLKLIPNAILPPKPKQ